MKPYTDYEPGRSKMPDDGQDIYVFRGDPERVARGNVVDTRCCAITACSGARGDNNVVA